MAMKERRESSRRYKVGDGSVSIRCEGAACDGMDTLLGALKEKWPKAEAVEERDETSKYSEDNDMMVGIAVPAEPAKGIKAKAKKKKEKS